MEQIIRINTHIHASEPSHSYCLTHRRPLKSCFHWQDLCLPLQRRPKRACFVHTFCGAGFCQIRFSPVCMVMNKLLHTPSVFILTISQRPYLPSTVSILLIQSLHHILFYDYLTYYCFRMPVFLSVSHRLLIIAELHCRSCVKTGASAAEKSLNFAKRLSLTSERSADKRWLPRRCKKTAWRSTWFLK